MGNVPPVAGHESLIAHLDATISFFEQERGRITKSIGSFMEQFQSDKIHEGFMRATSAVSRIAGKTSLYMDEIRSIRGSRYNPDVQFDMIIGTLKALRFELQQGYIRTLQELVHSDLFSDYLEMADYLLREGYKDAAAVIAGSTLEEHQRKLADKHGIEITYIDKTGKEQKKKAQRLNEDLHRTKIYSPSDHKLVTWLLSLRTSAAHGRYDEYKADQVDNMISAIRGLLSRLPA